MMKLNIGSLLLALWAQTNALELPGDHLQVNVSADGLRLDVLDVQSATSVEIQTSWNVTLATQTLAPEVCTLASAAKLAPSADGTRARVVWTCAKTGSQPPQHLPVYFSVDVEYAWSSSQRFLTKSVRVASSLPHSNIYGKFFIKEIAVWRSTTVTSKGPIGPALVTTNPLFNPAFGPGHIAAWARLPASTLFLSVQTPFVRLTSQANGGTAATLEGVYAPEIEHNVSFADPFHAADLGVLGFADRGQYQDATTGLYTYEAAAFRATADAFYLDGAMRRDKTVKVHVPWDESDYQIDVSTGDGWTEYKRIIDRCSELGIDHLIFEPHNDRHSARANTTDGWGWEQALWFTMGERIREGAFDPRSDPMPDDILQIVAYARGKGVRLLAYVYPCMSFEPVAQYLIPGDQAESLDLSVPEAAAWLQSTLIAFMEKSGAGGFSWDHDIFAGPNNLHYAQWRAWMGICRALRLRFPDIVMDHRDTSHIWGPWYQFAGSYPEPIASDENPETYGVQVPSLHTDHVAANNMRAANWKYSVQSLLPASRIPGFMFHQVERSDPNGTVPCKFGNPCYNLNQRDFDFQGYRYSVISNVATAGLNSVVTMLPARDEQEFALFPKEDVAFIRDWLSFTDANIGALARAAPIPTLSQPNLWGQVDGWHAMDTKDEGFVFLFNPTFAKRNVTLPIDEAVGVSNASAGSSWTVEELYPNRGQPRGSWTHGAHVTLELYGADALALRLTKKASPSTAAVTPVLTRGASGKSVRVPWSARPASAQACAGLAYTDEVDISFAGTPIEHGMPISSTPVPATFSGGWFNTTFSIPSAIFDQLKARQANYPIPWTANDRNASWLDPSRLLMTLAYAHPLTTAAPRARLNGASLKILWASNSRNGPASASQSCFTGYYIDASSFPPETMHSLSVWMPSVAPGDFQGLFWDNLDTEYTNDVVACSAVAGELRGKIHLSRLNF